MRVKYLEVRRGKEMTNEQAIKLLQWVLETYGENFNDDCIEAVNKGISAIKCVEGLPGVIVKKSKCDLCIYKHSSICGNCNDYDEFEVEQPVDKSKKTLLGLCKSANISLCYL